MINKDCINQHNINPKTVIGNHMNPRINLVMDTLKIILEILYCGLLFELIMGWSPLQNKKFYIRLFNPKIYYLTLLIAILLILIKPILDISFTSKYTLPMLAIPFFYLLLFKVINWISLIVNKRNIIIVGRSDNWPKEHKWYVDSMLHYTASILSIIIPFLISFYFKDKLN